MATDIDGLKVHGSPTIDIVEIPAEIAEAIEALPNRNANRKMVLPPWVDVVLTKYWKTKRHADIARELGISEGVIRRRAEELHL
jgi:DNA-binding NarL/FixJ family response regulator